MSEQTRREDFADRDRANYDVESIEREYDAMLKPLRCEDATEPKTIVATACNTCGEQQNAAGYCTNNQCEAAMSHCATCKWWRLTDPEPTQFPYYKPDVIWYLAKQCGALPDPDYDWRVSDEERQRLVEQLPVRFCTKVQVKEEMPHAGGAVAIDGENYFSALVTHGDFGCVMHEPSGEEK